MVRHKQIIGLSLSAFLLMLGNGMVQALLPQKVISLTGSSSLVGYLASTYALAQVLSQLPIGIRADRIGFKLFIIMGYLLSFSAGLLFYFTDTVNLIFVGKILQGIGEAPILSLAPALLSLQYFATKGKAIGTYNASIYLGLTAGPLVGVLLFKTWSDTQIFLFYAVMCLLGAVINSCSLENKADGEASAKDTHTLKSISVFFKDPQVLVVLLGIALYGAGFGIFITIVPAFLIMFKHYDQSYIGIFFSLFYIAISLSQLITGWLSDRLGRQLFMVVGLTVAAAGLRLSSTFEHLGLAVILGVSSLGLGIFYIASMAFLNENVPISLRGTISGMYYLFWGIGMFWGPIILGIYVDGKGFFSAFHLLASLSALEVMLLLLARRFKAKRLAQQ
ncbi:Predicted arabinose efflux permease, MFS family [Desulfotomaculum arcticum]|uniref:Predicted arabinose efflux permease, MFS family n=1 Tax=Desulfotruncus arcticus DSM 17038 TaxID=1121424 RepID=A0A1I2UQF2_9FIRM|nr:MFS transporter [Desulfotruncus arcticus]SFG79238.1 Predicted arabinose efflux permease, MFS family [Desulfotomaculum arcticum] [Desulfotruncus arcticus DSM 17038]